MEMFEESSNTEKCCDTTALVKPHFLPCLRVGWKKALKKVEDYRSEKVLNILDFFTEVSGSPSRTSIGEDLFVSRLCVLLGPHVVSKEDIQCLAKKLLSRRKTGFIIAKDIMNLLNINENLTAHSIFPDWLLERQDFCTIQNDNFLECSVRNLRVVSAARVIKQLRSSSDNNIIFSWMKVHCYFLTKHNSDKLVDFSREMEFHEYADNVTIYKHGDVANTVFMILTGEVAVMRENGSTICVLSADSYFGEKTLLNANSELRNHRVVTIVPTKVLSLTKEEYIRIMSNPTQYPARQDIALFLCNYCAPFRHFSFQHVLDTSRRVAIENYNGLNQVIVHQDDRVRGLYIIKNGSVDLTRVVSIKRVIKSLEDCSSDSAATKAEDLLEAHCKGDALVRITVATLGRGQIIGEACLDSMARRYLSYSAVTASENVEVYFLSKEEILTYFFAGNVAAEKKAFVKDINNLTEMRRIDDASLVLKFENEIREVLVRRKLKQLNLRPVRKLGVTYTTLGTSASSKSLYGDPKSNSLDIFRDQYDHRLNCFGVVQAPLHF